MSHWCLIPSNFDSLWGLFQCPRHWSALLSVYSAFWRNIFWGLTSLWQLSSEEARVPKAKVILPPPVHRPVLFLHCVPPGLSYVHSHVLFLTPVTTAFLLNSYHVSLAVQCYFIPEHYLHPLFFATYALLCKIPIGGNTWPRFISHIFYLYTLVQWSLILIGIRFTGGWGQGLGIFSEDCWCPGDTKRFCCKGCSLSNKHLRKSWRRGIANHFQRHLLPLFWLWVVLYTTNHRTQWLW